MAIVSTFLFFWTFMMMCFFDLIMDMLGVSQIPHPQNKKNI